MKSKGKGIYLSAVLATLLSGAAIAQEKHSHGEHNHKRGHNAHQHEPEHEHRQHGAHVHGKAHLMLVAEGSELVLQLESPAMNIVGFEHAPREERARLAVREAAAQLERFPELIALPEEAGCELRHSEVDSPLIRYLENGEDHGHHADFLAAYQLQCARPDRLRRLELTLFAVFPGIEALEVQWVTETGQGAATMSPADRQLRLR